jgi:hypothetical protein
VVYPDSGTQSEPAAAPGWKAVLAAIPSTFGRLVYLHSLAGRPDRLIGHSHQQVFSQWLMLGLAEQLRDLREYYENTPAPLNYRELVPVNAREVERQLYLTDMETLIELLRVEGVTEASAF